MLSLSISSASKNSRLGRRIRYAPNEHNAVSRRADSTADGGLSRAATGQPHARRRPLAQHLAAEAEQLGRPAAGRGCALPVPSTRPAVLDQAAEVLLVQAHAGQRLDRRAAAASRVNAGGSSSKTTGRYLSLPRSAAERGREDAAVVERHRRARAHDAVAGAGRAPGALAGRRGRQPRAPARPRRAARSARAPARRPTAAAEAERQVDALAAQPRLPAGAAAPSARAPAARVSIDASGGRPSRQSSHGR